MFDRVRAAAVGCNTIYDALQLQVIEGTVMAFRERNLKYLIYVSVGTIEWVGLMALEARHNPNFNGFYYELAVFPSALVLGIVDRKTSHLLAGFLLIAPALCLALWTAPQGDGNGFFLLWFPILGIYAVVACVCHWIGATIGNAARAK